MKRNVLGRILAISMLWLGLSTSQAQESGLCLHYNFEGTSGTTVPDQSGTGANATLKNNAKVVEMGKYHILDLGNGTGYLDLSSKAGDALRATDSYTVSLYYYVDKNASLTGNGYFLWTFSTAEACGSTSGKYAAYRLNAQRFANSTGGYSNETGIEVSSASEKGSWIHVAYTQDGASGRLYINGTLKGTSSAMPLNSTNLTTTLPYCWIGRAPFSGDNYLKQTMVADFRLYNEALSATRIAELAQETESLEYEYRYGLPGDFSALQAAITTGRQALESGNYTQAARDDFEDVLNLSATLVEEGKVNQSIIDDQLARLNTALATLKATDGLVFDTDHTEAGYNTDRGFRHPGALHTDKDFERIRQQLASNNLTVKNAYEVLVNAAYAQSDVQTYPVETIVRGGGVGENYINAARGATMAYQNALRWKIDGSREHASAAVRILNQWAQTTKYIGGDSNYALAAGLYGYAFANAAELVRDYDGWKADDFEAFRRWMLDVWYPTAIGFLRHRNGTWENADKWWQAPGHYWSNWGLCNALAVVSIGILCDDVFIYNQGMSFFKYDQVGTFKDPRTSTPILNDGLTEFLGNLVVTTTTSDLETGAYGKLGQMQESGRDIGHATMAAGLAIDLAHVGWNQGDDLFSFMDNRLAAGMEYVAAQTQGIENLPWTNYHVATNGYYYTDYRAWLQTGPALGEQIRPYWGTVIGHYEGIKGVEMPFSKWAYNKMGIDGGGQGSTSGGYDHLGYSVLMNTYDGINPADKVPTPLSGQMLYNGTTIAHNELGGLKNTYQTDNKTGVARGALITLQPQLPDGTTDTGRWQWNTGETTRDITVTTDRSGVYRVTYTNQNGIESEQVFTIATDGDCEESKIGTSIAYNGRTINGTSISVLYGSEVTLTINGYGGYGTYLWENGKTTNTITLPSVTKDREISAIYTNQGGRKSLRTFRITVNTVRPDFSRNGVTSTDSLIVVAQAGDNVVLSPTVAGTQAYGTWLWDDGDTNRERTIDNVQASGEYTVTYTLKEDHAEVFTYKVLVQDDTDLEMTIGDYMIRHTDYNTYLTNLGDGLTPVFAPLDADTPQSQYWHLNRTTNTSCSLRSLLDNTYVNKTGAYATSETRAFRFRSAVGYPYLAIRKVATSGGIYWQVDADGNIDYAATEGPNDYPFELIPVTYDPSASPATRTAGADIVSVQYFGLDGKAHARAQKGIQLRKTLYADGHSVVEKVCVPR